MNNKIILISIFLVAALIVAESASVPFPFNDSPPKMRITLEFDGEGSDVNECDAKCIKHCAKEYTKDPKGFVQCMKDCGCIPPSEIEADENAYEIQESNNNEKPDFLSYLTPQKTKDVDCKGKCCPVCMHKCMSYCPKKKDKSQCKEHCKFFCCHDSSESE